MEQCFIAIGNGRTKNVFEVTKDRDIATLVLGEKVYEITYRGGKELDPQKDDSVRLGIIRRHYSLGAGSCASG